MSNTFRRGTDSEMAQAVLRQLFNEGFDDDLESFVNNLQRSEEEIKNQDIEYTVKYDTILDYRPATLAEHLRAPADMMDQLPLIPKYKECMEHLLIDEDGDFDTREICKLHELWRGETHECILTKQQAIANIRALKDGIDNLVDNKKYLTSYAKIRPVNLINLYLHMLATWTMAVSTTVNLSTLTTPLNPPTTIEL